MTQAQIINPLTEGVRGPRLSYVRFKKAVSSVAERHGKAILVLTFRASETAYEESIDLEELDKPRTGLYRARVDDMEGGIEAEFVDTMDERPRDQRNVLDRGYQELIETQRIQASFQAQHAIALESKLATERTLRMEAEDKLRVAERRVEELEEELEEADEPLLDASTIKLIRELMGDFTGAARQAQAAQEALDVLDAHPEVADKLTAVVPQVILLLARIAGEDDEQQESEPEDA